MYTVKQLSNMAGVSVRTLHYYDEKELLKPAAVGQNNYRYYTDESLFQLQQILLYREMDLSLGQIKKIIGDPDFDMTKALRSHRQTLQAKIARLQTLISTVDKTIMHLNGDSTMSDDGIFAGFTPEKQKEFEKEAAQQYGAEEVNKSVKLWSSYSKGKQKQIMQEGKVIYRDFVKEMGQGAESEAVQAIVARWHEHTRNFYEPSLERLRGLGDLYNSDPAFQATFVAFHPDLPAFLQQAINLYVDGLETGR